MNTQKIKLKKLISFNRYFFFPIALVVFFLAFYMIYEDIKSKTIDEFNYEQLLLAKTASQGITSFFDNYQSELTFLAQYKEIINFSDESKALMANFYETHKSTISAITRIDSTGVILYTFPYNQLAIGQDISYQKHVQQVLVEKTPVLSDVFMSAQGYLAIALHVPVYKDKTFAGSLAILIPIDELGKLYLGKIENRKNGHAWLLSENGIEIYCPINGHTGKSLHENTKHHDTSIDVLEKIINYNEGTGKSIHQEISDEGKTELKDLYFVFYRTPLGNTYWTILISYQEKDIYIALTRLRNRLIFVFSLLFIALLFYFYSLVKVRNVLKEEAKRKEAEKTLLKSEEKFRRIFDEHAAVKLLIDPKSGNIVDANKSASNYYGWSCEELRKMNIEHLNIISPQEIKKNLESVLTEKRIQFEFKHRLRDNSIRDVEVLSSKIKIDNHDLVHSIIHDITKRKNAEALLKVKTDEIETQNEQYLQINEELNQKNIELIVAKEQAEESDRLKSAFLANMSHEIRTPMNSIIGFTELLKKPDLNINQQQEYVDIIQKGGNRLLNIINDIINISKIESGITDIHLSETNINNHFKFVYNSLKINAESKKLKFSFNCILPEKEAVINTDSEKLFGILINLVKNAIKFTDKGAIEFGYAKKGEDLEFYIKDTGIGIPKEKQEFIFERFFQIDIFDKMARQGSGLGLAISKSYVEMLGGRIWVESEEGIGSTFFFTLPYSIASQNKIKTDTGVFSRNKREPIISEISELKILIVEDDEISAKLISIELEKFSKEILKVTTGIEAVETCRNNADIDLVLMDIKMSGINGYEATRKIRNFNQDVIIIAQTAFALTGDKEKALEAGCNAYISKPIKQDELFALIKKYFGK